MYRESQELKWFFDHPKMDICLVIIFVAPSYINMNIDKYILVVLLDQLQEIHIISTYSSVSQTKSLQQTSTSRLAIRSSLKIQIEGKSVCHAKGKLIRVATRKTIMKSTITSECTSHFHSSFSPIVPSVALSPVSLNYRHKFVLAPAFLICIRILH